MGEHSRSWATADEIINGKLPGTLRRTGVVEIADYEKWDGVSCPGKWSGGIMGPGILVSERNAINDRTTHVRIEWDQDQSEDLMYFINGAKRLKDLHGEVRFVFGFDS